MLINSKTKKKKGKKNWYKFVFDPIQKPKKKKGSFFSKVELFLASFFLYIFSLVELHTVLVLCIVQRKGFSVILSDMCPLVSGITTKDAVLSAELGMQALHLAVGGPALAPSGDEIQKGEHHDDSTSGPDDDGILQPGGHLVIKLLESEDAQGGHFYCRVHTSALPFCVEFLMFLTLFWSFVLQDLAGFANHSSERHHG